jgi:hypothetical protein
MPALARTLAAAGALALAALVPTQASAAAGDWQLPDLDQEAPSGLVVANGTAGGPRRYLLGFRSAVRNVGSGPLVIRGHRGSRDTPTMTATQIIRGPGAAERRVGGVGRMRYVVSPSHRHWHLLSFDRYTLRRIGGGRRVVRRDRKTGFCLGDRYQATAVVAGTPPTTPEFTSNCGLLQPGRLNVSEGISVGYGDDYAANLEGQYIPFGDLPGGRYLLIHQVNSGHGLRELRYDNDAASLLLSLQWTNGLPFVRVLASCPDSARCAAPASRSRVQRHRRLAAAPVAVQQRAFLFYCPLAATD